MYRILVHAFVESTIITYIFMLGNDWLVMNLSQLCPFVLMSAVMKSASPVHLASISGL